MIRAAMSDDCTGDPPGELISSATAAGFPFRKAFSITGPMVASFNAPRLPLPIRPDKRITATVGRFCKNGKPRIMIPM